jgi:hypothetical protein
MRSVRGNMRRLRGFPGASQATAGRKEEALRARDVPFDRLNLAD